jgi:NADPH:quinone reductase-like Zn-dependent oxidoreductase
MGTGVVKDCRAARSVRPIRKEWGNSITYKNSTAAKKVMNGDNNEMKAVVIDGFGGPEVLTVRNVSVPDVGPEQILIKVDSAGVGVWDIGERQGMIAQMFGIREPIFPWVIGSEGAGTIVAAGENVSGFQVGDLVYGHVWAKNPKAGFYAEYTPVDADHAWAIPSTLTTEKAGALLIDGATALRGLDDTLGLEQDEKLMVFGASGGVGHFAIQLAKILGAQVFAIASGEDGVALCQELGADAAVDGHGGDMAAAARDFAPDGFDAALLTAGGKVADRALASMREGGRVAFPWHPQQRPDPKVPANVRTQAFDANIDQALITKLNNLIEAGPFDVHLGNTFSLDQVGDAHQALSSHYLGRLALLPGL